MKKHVIGVLAFLFALTLVAGACSSKSSGGGGGGDSGGGTITLNGQTTNDHGTKDVSGGGSVEVEVDSFYFNPTLFTAHAGDNLTLELSNESDRLHNFSLPDQSIDKDIQPGSKLEVTVTFATSGTLVFFCKYHQSSGMLGGLQVETG